MIPARPVVLPVMPCSQLLSEDFTNVPGAPPTSLTSATLVGTGAASTATCSATYRPKPSSSCGCPPARTRVDTCRPVAAATAAPSRSASRPRADTAAALTSNTFAVSSNNEGHTATGPWDVWGAPDASNPLRAEFGYLADHYNAVVAKAIITTFYGTAPAYSYFDGYSDGGRAAVQEAQRYPHDFNGIVAGAPAIEIQDALVMFDFAAQHLYDSSGNTDLQPSRRSRHCTTRRSRPAVSTDRSTIRGCVIGTRLPFSAAPR